VWAAVRSIHAASSPSNEVQLVTDREGSMLQLQKGQIKVASMLLMAVHVLPTFIIDVVTTF